MVMQKTQSSLKQLETGENVSMRGKKNSRGKSAFTV